MFQQRLCRFVNLHLSWMLTPAALDQKHEGEVLDAISGKHIGQSPLVFIAISSIIFKVQIWCWFWFMGRGLL